MAETKDKLVTVEDLKAALDGVSGTWTPTVSGGSASGLTVSEGKYYRLGALVYARLKWASSQANSGKYAAVSGLPFTPGMAYYGNTVNTSTNMAGLATARSDGTVHLQFRSNQAAASAGDSGYAWAIYNL